MKMPNQISGWKSCQLNSEKFCKNSILCCEGSRCSLLVASDNQIRERMVSWYSGKSIEKFDFEAFVKNLMISRIESRQHHQISSFAFSSWKTPCLDYYWTKPMIPKFFAGCEEIFGCERLTGQ
ncbi:hypothetical protein QG37_07991 [Candidozyma auris]|uniref:Uncharacterized protein n=1 Tax=Candidozyma auris TaxID=498019 RepID=A0A0L0NNQ1_CANAR|nr:hypothetical protein QG37_07991 [[Candida] auris]